MRLEALIAHLPPEYRARVARNLQLPDDSIARLKIIAQVQDIVNQMTSTPFVEAHRGGGVAFEDKIRPSQVVQLLRQYDVPMLILIAMQSSRVIRRKIWQYLTIWRNVQPILNGNDLQQIGYKPGPQYRQMLDDLLAATLDKVICNKTQAEEFLTKHYPR
jgi:tRNA nucleotidyltransferase (CCA-adding enzyme)